MSGRASWFFVSLLLCFLSACESGDHEDLRRWTQENGQQLQANIQKLPEMKPYQAVSYDVESLVDPFRPGRIEPEGKLRNSGKGGPDFDARELRNSLLEKYPLESMKMIGYLHVDRKPMAVVQVEDKVKQVRVGDYMGQDFGLVKRVTESEIELHELVQDSTGEWTERTSLLYLQSTDGGKK